MAESKAEKEERESGSDSDYDPRDKYYLRVDDDEYKNMTSTTAEPIQDDRNRDGADRERGDRRRASPRRSKGRDESARYIDPDGEAAKSFLDKLTKGVDMKSVGKVGLDAAAVAAIKIAVGTQVPWKQRIPRTITVGAAAAIMDFVVKKTSFKPKGMIGTIYARQFVEIVLANLIVNPVSSKVTGAAQNAKAKATAGKPGGGGAGKR
ncbi:hypothetical protein UCDDA912_g02053 [Diaporthe ampelina]|uniref:Uncharacterized protein n=1 Tax=Diaporthe ampelina TaxID=1214573 RepID=A0A0G2FVE0_9PEZI|nr:hypothetical protein UCDDA912_g02053 [Diaporthe ampelina]